MGAENKLAALDSAGTGFYSNPHESVEFVQRVFDKSNKTWHVATHYQPFEGVAALLFKLTEKYQQAWEEAWATSFAAEKSTDHCKADMPNVELVSQATTKSLIRQLALNESSYNPLDMEKYHLTNQQKREGTTLLGHKLEDGSLLFQITGEPHD